jgi:hypothetical protein
MTKAENVFSSLEKSLGFRDPKTNVYEVKVVAEYTIELEADSPKEAKKLLKHYIGGEIIDIETNEVIEEVESYTSWIWSNWNILLKQDNIKINEPKKVARGWRNNILFNRK